MSLLQARGITKSFGSRLILDGLDLDDAELAVDVEVVHLALCHRYGEFTGAVTVADRCSEGLFDGVAVEGVVAASGFAGVALASSTFLRQWGQDSSGAFGSLSCSSVRRTFLRQWGQV